MPIAVPTPARGHQTSRRRTSSAAAARAARRRTRSRAGAGRADRHAATISKGCDRRPAEPPTTADTAAAIGIVIDSPSMPRSESPRAASRGCTSPRTPRRRPRRKSEAVHRPRPRLREEDDPDQSRIGQASRLSDRVPMTARPERTQDSIATAVPSGRRATDDRNRTVMTPVVAPRATAAARSALVRPAKVGAVQREEDQRAGASRSHTVPAGPTDANRPVDSAAASCTARIASAASDKRGEPIGGMDHRANDRGVESTCLRIRTLRTWLTRRAWS